MEISLISGLMERNNDETNSEWKYGRLALIARKNHYTHARGQIIRCPSALKLHENWYHSITIDFALIGYNSTTNNNSYYPMKFNNNDLKRTSNQ